MELFPASQDSKTLYGTIAKTFSKSAKVQIATYKKNFKFPNFF